MRAGDFTREKGGKLVRNPQGVWAFVPDPLPPDVRPTWDLALELSAADRALSELGGIARNLPNPRLLIRPFMQREAVLSSRIEGTQASLSDLLLLEASGKPDTRVPDAQEVLNYVNALEYGVRRLRRLPLSLRLIRELHARLMKGVRGHRLAPGELRRSQNWIGPPGCAIEDAAFVPPPVTEMHAALDHLEKFLHARSSFPPLVRHAMIHYQFEAIHPFLDGNGRIGRLLLILLLCSEGLLPSPLLYLSAYFERLRSEYYDHLMGVSRSGKWTDWIRFFLKGVEEQSRDAIRRSGRLLDLWKKYREELQTIRSSSLLLQMADGLFFHPATTIAQVARRLEVTNRSALLNVEKLVRLGILKEATGRKRNRVFIAPEIVKIVGAP